MAAIVVGLVVSAVGLWLAVARGGTDMGGFGWLLLALGVVSVVVNLSLRRRGFRTPRRRP